MRSGICGGPRKSRAERLGLRCLSPGFADEALAVNGRVADVDVVIGRDADAKCFEG